MKKKFVIPAVCVGFINGLLGAGGGMLAVPALKKCGLNQQQSHANSIAIILPVSLLSAIFYIWKGSVNVMQALPYIPGGLIGAILGAWALTKIPPRILKKIFGIFAIWAGVRLLF